MDQNNILNTAALKTKKSNRIIMHLLLGIFFSGIFFPLQSQEKTALEIIKSYEDQTRGNTSYGRFEITVERPRYSRTMKIDSWDDTKNDKAFMKILEPKKDSGITFLKAGNNLWQYIPKIGKEIKIEGSLMQDSWMGSDFTNDDLVKKTSIVDDFEHKFIHSEDAKLYTIQMTPKPSTAVIWNKIVITIQKNDLMPVQQMFYDHKDRLARVMDFSDYRIMGGRLIPTTMKVYTVKKGKKISSTELKYISVQFNIPLSDYIFSKANLRR